MPPILLETILSLGLGVGVPVVLGWLGANIRNQGMRDALNAAASRAAGIGYDYLVRVNSGVPLSRARNEAIEAGMAYLRTTMPDTLKAFGLDSVKLQAFVSGELGKLLASDPTVTTGMKP